MHRLSQPLRGVPLPLKEQHVQRSASRQDQHLRPPLRREVSHVVLHEIAHHFGISDERLIELDRY